jgi:hypothetical protein
MFFIFFFRYDSSSKSLLFTSVSDSSLEQSDSRFLFFDFFDPDFLVDEFTCLFLFLTLFLGVPLIASVWPEVGYN